MSEARWLPYPLVVGRLTATVQQAGIAIEGGWARGGDRDRATRKLLQMMRWVAAQKADEAVSGVGATMMADGNVRLAVYPPSEGAATMNAGRLLDAVSTWLLSPLGDTAFSA